MWEAKLTNGETRTQKKRNDITEWREFYNYCKQHGLEITEFKFNGKVFDKNADMYFVVFRQTAYGNPAYNQFRIGIGSYRKKTNKSRVEWRHVENGELDYVEMDRQIHPVATKLGINKDNEVS